MKLIFPIFLILTFLFQVSIFSDPQSDASDLCDCLKKAKESSSPKDAKKCQSLREKQVKAMGKKSPDYKVYLENLGECERKLMNISTEDNQSVENQKKAVCDCFANVSSGKEKKFKCFQIQNEYAKKINSSDERTQFINDTNSCDK